MGDSSPEPSSAAMGPWEIATERSAEIHRTGHGVETMQAALEHLRLRGDSEAHYRRMEDAEPWVRVNLLVPLPIGGSHRAS